MGIAQKPRFSVAITTPAYQKLINNTLGDPGRAARFVAAITSAVAVNPALQECDAGTILAGALLGESLNLSPSPQLGQYYLVPFKDKKRDCTLAQFILGYKGYIQLAIRSGQYKKLNVVEIKQGELISYDPLSESIEYKPIEDYGAREKASTIGYYAYFRYVNGFEKAIYWSKEKMLSHADRYSPAFSASAYIKLQNNEIPQTDMWKYSSFWYKNFDTMALKTMLRQLISHWGVMSVEMLKAYDSDERAALVSDKGEILTVTDEPPPIDIQPEARDIVEKINLDDIE
jgi:recombination protein RecT